MLRGSAPPSALTVLSLYILTLCDAAVLQVMPYVSLCAQKAAHLQKLLQPLGRKVKSLFGGLGGVAVTPTTGVGACHELTQPCSPVYQ